MTQNKQIEKFKKLLKSDLADEIKQGIRNKLNLLKGDKIIMK